MFDEKRKIGKELKALIIMGNCPCCGSEKIKYREYITNRTFGFQCFHCGWESQYNLAELRKASENWFSV